MAIFVETMFRRDGFESRDFPVHVEGKLVKCFLEEFGGLPQAFEGTLSAFESYGSVGWKGWLGFPERQWELYHTVRADPYVRHDLVKEGTLVVFVSIQLVLFGALNGEGSLFAIVEIALNIRRGVDNVLGLGFEDRGIRRFRRGSGGGGRGM